MATATLGQRLNNIRAPQRKGIIGFFVVLLLVEWYLYFREPGHFFQADSIFLLYNRVRSVSEFLREFIRLHPSGWYRPLANQPVESLLFPILGLSPTGYRIPVYALFIADTVAVYAFAWAISRRQLASAIATFFFAIHTTNAYTTYDVAFIPELQYTLFYLASALAYLRYLEQGKISANRLSMVCFVGSLFSKEAAVTLPVTLVVLHVLMSPTTESVGTRFLRALRSTLGHFLILFVYVVFVVGYLHVQGVTFTMLVTGPPATRPLTSDAYNLVLGQTIPKNMDVAMTWAFNIPRGWITEARQVAPWMVTFLKVFRALTVTLVAFVLIRQQQRKTVLIGLALFLVTLIPALPLFDHFLPYYLFLPLAGFSLVIGVALAWLHDSVRRWHPLASVATLLVILSGLLFVCSKSIDADMHQNTLLGGSAELALNSLNDLNQLYPTLPAKTTIYFEDAEQPTIWWHHSSGGLFKMFYNREDISTLYSALGDPLVPEGAIDGKLIVLKVQNKRLVDRTVAFHADPGPWIRYTDSGLHTLSLSATEVVAGRDSYSVAITGLQNTNVRIMYILNDGPMEAFTAQLDDNGRVTFYVSEVTRKGLYRFVGFNIRGQAEWVRAQAVITVR